MGKLIYKGEELTGVARKATQIIYDNTDSKLTADNAQGAIDELAAKIYPIGSIYMSVNSISPATLFGGSWERITGKFLLSATDNGNSGASQAAGNTGGSDSVTLTNSQMPYHRHSIPALSGTASSTGSAHAHYSGSNWIDGATMGGGTNRRVFCLGGGSGLTSGYLTASDGAHSHSVTTTTSNTGYEGGSNGVTQAHDNMPPYLSVYVWKRTA